MPKHQHYKKLRWLYLIPRIIGQVRPGSPAERAGLEPSDRVLMVEGIHFDDQKRIVELGRPRIDERRSIVVERGGDQLHPDAGSVALLFCV